MDWRGHFAKRLKHVRASNMFLSKEAVAKGIISDCFRAMTGAIVDEAHDNALKTIVDNPEMMKAIAAATANVPHTEPAGLERKYA